MAIMYVQTRTGGWATHKETPTGTTGRKKASDTPLYTLEQAISLGYQPVEKKANLEPFKTKRSMKVYVGLSAPVVTKESIQIGKVVFNDGAEEPIEFSRTPSRTLKTYKERGNTSYTARRLTVNDRGQWVRVEYTNRRGKEGLPLKRESREVGYYTKLELADQKRTDRDVWFNKCGGLLQDLLLGLAKGSVEVKIHGTVRERPAAPKKAEWLQKWYNRRIWLSQRYPEWYALYQEWKRNRFEGDAQVFGGLQEWAVRDSHLVKIEEAHRKMWVNRRNDQYKKLAYRLVMESKGGLLELFRPDLKKKGVRHSKEELEDQNQSELQSHLCKSISDDVKDTKPELLTEKSASELQRLISSAAWSTFCEYLKKCADREGVKLIVHTGQK